MSHQISPDRTLEQQEMDLIRRVLENSSLGIEFLPQLQHARAMSACTCGCPTISLHIGSNAPRATSDERIVSKNYYGKTEEGVQVGIIVWAENGFLSQMEIYNLDGDYSGPFGLPLVETLRAF